MESTGTPSAALAGTAAASAASPLRDLQVATLALACAAPLMILLARASNLPPDAFGIFERLFFFGDYYNALAVAAALLLALAVPRVQDAIVRLAHWVADHPAATIALAFVVLAACSRLVYLAHPLAMDEYAPWMQAHVFAQGSIAAHYPPDLLDALVPKGFQGMFFAVDRATGAAVSKYWPGLALVLTPFVWLDIGWCANPAFAALALAMIYKLATEAAGNRLAGGWAMLAALASPQFTVNAISLYAMPGELALNLLFVWLLLKPRLATSFAAGLVGGLALAMHNPLPHALMAIPCLAWLALDRQRWPRLLAVLAGYLPLVVVLGWGWSTVMASLEIAPRTGGPSMEQSILVRALDFAGQMVGLPNGEMLTARWYATWKTWVWACPGLLLVLFVPRARGTGERLLLAAFALAYVFYLFVRPDQGHGWGYRYIHPAWAVLPLAAGLFFAEATEAARRWGAAVIAAGLLATPMFLWQTHATIEDALSWRLAPPAPGHWIVFVAQDTGAYRGDLVQNARTDTGVLYFVSQGEARDQALMARRFPGAVETLHERRGSLWRVPADVMAKALQAPAAAR